MKYKTEIVVDLPRKKVIELFDNMDNMQHWQEGFIDYRLLEGKAGQSGAKTLLHYKMGKRKIEMVETITERNLPDVFSASYETKGVWNEVKNYFEETGDNQTKWISENEFQFTTFFMKLMGFIMPGAFKKQSYKYMVDFKKFAESAEK
jgi:hypothetical protein